MRQIITSFSLENSIIVIPRLLPAAKDELTKAREIINAREIEPTNTFFMAHSPYLPGKKI